MIKAGACADGRLDDELAATLEPRLQDVLNHPSRRQILRFLHSTERACSVNEILGRLPLLTRAEVDYHLRVLHGAGSVFVDGSRPAVRGRDLLYRSALSDEAHARVALRAMERADSDRRKGAGSQPSGLLAMFRVPRPDRAIRLGDRRERKTKLDE